MVGRVGRHLSDPRRSEPSVVGGLILRSGADEYFQAVIDQTLIAELSPSTMEPAMRRTETAEHQAHRGVLPFLGMKGQSRAVSMAMKRGGPFKRFWPN